MRIEVQNNVINKEVLERNKKYLMPNWKNNLARIYIILFLVLSIICLIQGTSEMRLYAFAAFTVAAVFFFARIYVTKRNINLILAKQIEMLGKEEVFYSLIFGNSGVNIIVSSDKTSQIKYEDINKIIDTPKDFVFISKHSFFINTANCDCVITIIINANQRFEALDLENGIVEISKKGLYIKMPKKEFDKYFLPVK